MDYIYYKNAKISYSDNGNGIPVVLLHGFLENSTMWDFYTSYFSKKYRIIAIDLLGHGKTDSMSYMHTMEDMADAVHAVLSHLDIAEAIFIGHSMGGYVSLAIAELYPEIIKGIVLLNSTSKEDSQERKLNRMRAVKAVKQNADIFVSMSIANLFSEENRGKLINEIEAVKLQALKTPLQGIISALEGMKVRKDREFLLHQATFPILLILGKKDPVLNYGDNISQSEATPVKLVTLPDGHMSHIENREDLILILNNFFKNF
ncbi:alpha/beta hydrolase [Flavobacterium amniphilum]|uniref:alpha/beta fold hydrolase n=1 Tax=Flavobacterium amniphilum TaxID=1834035 RepID=UPI00202A2949|nr:alpha/beta hydrolase [Flavobacterium amniphilum]MCL9806001.1 alpha/beta hydrolase [Flavobacterium amniphilum]